MNSWGFIRLIAFAVLVVLTQQSNGSGVTLCQEFDFGNTVVYECENDKFCVTNTINVEKNEYIKLLITNGFQNINYTATTSEQILINGFESGIELIVNQPTAAVSIIRQALRDTKDLYYHAGAILYQNLGEANAVSSDSARQGFRKAIEIIEVIGVEGINVMNTAEKLANEAMELGGFAAKYALRSALHFIRSTFAAGFDELPFSYQQAVNAVSDAQQMPTQGYVKAHNADAATDDIHASAAISDIRKAAKSSIYKGAAADKVEQLKKSLINSLCAIAQIASDVREYFTRVHNLEKSSADNIFIKGAMQRIREETADIILDLGGAGLKSDSSAKKQIAKAIVPMEIAVTKTNLSYKTAADWTLRALSMEDGSTRTLLLNAAEHRAEYGTVIYYQKIVEAAKIVFNIL